MASLRGRRRPRLAALLVTAVALAASACAPVAPSAPAPPAPAPPAPAATAAGGPGPTASVPPAPDVPAETFAIIGDFGTGGDAAAAVAELVTSWNPDYVVAVGDTYYAEAGGRGAARYDVSVGAHYCRWLAGVTTTGDRCRRGLAARNAFFPALGNHDYADAGPSPEEYLSYFDLPGAGFANSSGNERFYDFVHGPIHFFVLDSDPAEPAGTSSTSAQARWFRSQLSASTSPWNVVVDHHPPYSSDEVHGSRADLQWPFAAWGADAVVSGHAHTYERILRDGIVYFVNGLGGASRYGFTTPVRGSASRYSDDWGAQLVHATATEITFAFHAVDGTLVDSYTLRTRGG